MLDYIPFFTCVSAELLETLQFAGSGFMLRSARIATRILHPRALQKKKKDPNRFPAANYLFFSRAFKKFFPNGAMILQGPERRSEALQSPRMAAEPESCSEVVEVSRLQLQARPSHRDCTGRSVFTPVCHFMVRVCPLLPGTLKAKGLESLKRK